MLYSREELSNKSFIDSHAVVQRYINKVFPRRKEFKKLKWHELDFLFQHMKIMKNNKGEYAFNLLEYPEAQNYVLYCIILIYGTSSFCIDFKQKVSDYTGVISSKRKAKHQSFFYKKLNEWFDEFIKGSGPYYSVMKPMYERKIKELLDWKNNKAINSHTYANRVIYTKACFFHIYYFVRLYFDEYKFKANFRNIFGFDFYGDIFTYTHVLNRHYFPYMNLGNGASMNDDIPGVEIRNLPASLLDLVELHAKYKAIDKKTEYLLFRINCDPYILWIKYGKIGTLQNVEGFEIRSFYKCSEQWDFDKYNGTTEIKVDDQITVVL